MGKDYKERDRLLSSRPDSLQDSQRIKKVAIDTVFSNWVTFFLKCQSYVSLEAKRALRASIFSFTTESSSFFEKQSVFEKSLR